jgi:chloramphenicol-sensitive protein RarD
VTDGRASLREGLLYGFGAYGLWGLMPIYFHAITRAGPYEILCHRIVWSLVLLLPLLTLTRSWPDVTRCLRSPRTLAMLAVTTLLLALNWFAFIYAVCLQHVEYTSLGYYITPLVSTLLGLAFLGERLRPWQWVALALATAGIAVRVWSLGELPWIALTVAGSFGLYGFLRKQMPVESLVGLSIETAMLFPAALAALLWWGHEGTGVFGQEMKLSVLLAVSGITTAIPLLFFGAAARRLPLTVLGVLQYLAPSCQLIIAVVWLGESFDTSSAVTFGLIWMSLAVFTAESLLRRPAPKMTPLAPSASEGKFHPSLALGANEAITATDSRLGTSRSS